MICATIQNENLDGIIRKLEHVEMAEIRLDRCDLDNDGIGICFSEDLPLVATCRISEILERDPLLSSPECTFTEEGKIIKASGIAEKKLSKAIEEGAKYVDIELGAPKQMSRRIQKLSRENGTVVIRSYHDFEKTPSLEELQDIVDKCIYYGADIIKIVTTAQSEEDADRVMSLYDKKIWKGRGQAPESAGLIAFCMGEKGRRSRLECLKHGSPFTYASLGEEAAPGQMPYEEMCRTLYGGFRFFDGNVNVPSSKSFAQRAVIAAALADGESHLHGYTPCSDSDAALEAARTLGADVKVEGRDITIRGIGYDGTQKLNISEIDAGESGLLARLLIPLMALAADNEVTITGRNTLVSRSMDGIQEMMDALGSSVDYLGQGCTIPLKVRGPLGSGRIGISGKNGSQLISGLLMALPLGQKNTTLVVSDPKSIPYMYITIDVLKHFGIKVSSEMSGGRDFFESEGDWNLCTEIDFKIKGGQRMKAADMDIEGDWSAAANFLVAGAVFGKCVISGLDTGSLQADLTMMDILMDAGASLSQLDGKKGDICVQRAPLNAFEVDCSHCPDLFPIVSVLAAFCQGESRIRGLGRLAHKESNRADAIMEMLEKLGVDCSAHADNLVIEGHSLSRRLSENKLLKGGEFSSHHDHRMAMALKVASLGCSSPLIIDDEGCTGKSFPGFIGIWNEIM